jgi:hypothetical protein
MIEIKMEANMKQTTRFILFLFLVFCPIYPALADKLYQIEILVFEQPDKRALGEEWWPENPGSPNIDQATQTAFIAPAQLKKPGNVKILLHTAWQQPIGEKAQSPYIKIANQNELEGTININSSRFLHADVDLLLQKNMKITRQKPGLLGVSANPAASGENRPVTFRLKQSQKIKSNEIRYFDHPAFGLTLLISPVP